MNNLTPLEYETMRKLLAGEDHILSILREQLGLARVIRREMTGVGFFSTFWIPPDAQLAPTNYSFKLGDVKASIQGISHGAGFLLFVKEGRLDMLEGFTYDEPWPNQIQNFELSYINSTYRDMEPVRHKIHGENAPE